MTDLIRWEPNGYGGYLGYAGTMESHVFQIWKYQRHDAEWTLTSPLPIPLNGRVSLGTDPEQGPLQDEAERLLREFAASIGAVFPEPEPGPGGYVTAYSGRRKCRYCPEYARWDVGGILSCVILTHLARALEDLTARKPLTGDDR